MDLSYIADLLDDFATFAGAIKDFVTLPVSILNDVLGNDYEAGAALTSSIAENLSAEPTEA